MKNTKAALLTSVISLLLCVSMLVGTTFAWFTDTASTGVNKIQAGTLDIQILDASNNEATDLKWKTADGRTQAEILWEPGARYELEPFTIKNNGSLALKYKVQITGIVGDAKLLEVIDFTYKMGANDFDINAEHTLAAGKSTEEITIQGVMKETAGNEYQGLSIENISITVYATQAMEEQDSFDETYDGKAQYAVSVSTQEELDKALASEGSAKITIESGADLKITDQTYVGKNPGTTIENFGTLTMTGAVIYSTDIEEQGRAAITNYGTLIVENSTLGSKQSRGNAIRNYGTATVKNSELTCCDNYLNGGYAYVFATSDGTLTVENCTYEGAANGVFAADGGEIIINSGNYKLTGNKSWHMFYMVKGTITVNGGTFEKTDATRAFAGGTVDTEHLIINGGTFTYNGNPWTLN